MRLLAILLLLTAAAAWSADWKSLDTLTAGAEVRVTLTGGKTVRGFFQQATPEAIVLNAAKSQETFARAEVRRVQLKKPGHRGRNTLIGLAIGTTAGLTAGAVIDSKATDYWFPNVGKAVLSPIGALIGTVIGVAIPTGRWRDVYRVR